MDPLFQFFKVSLPGFSGNAFHTCLVDDWPLSLAIDTKKRTKAKIKVFV